VKLPVRLRRRVGHRNRRICFAGDRRKRLYYACFESSTWQGTPGKKVLNIAVTDLTGARISFGRASGRFFAKIYHAPDSARIGFILAGITERKQALHDMIASTLVLRR